MIQKRVIAVLSLTALAAGLLAASPTASAGHAAVSIQVGAPLGGDNLPAESMRFFGPDTLNVHQGDKMTFNFRGFHTATMLPAGVGADDWLDDNANDGGPYSFAIPDTDDGAGAYKDNFFQGVISPTHTNCGAAGQDACNYSGDDVLNSGAPFELPASFTASVNAQPGSTFWVICLIHHNMRKRVRVVQDPASATPQSTIDAVRQQQVTRDKDWAMATHAKYSVKQTSHETASGRRVWDAWAGVDSRFVSLFAFYPKRLTIDKGDTVRWRFDSLVHEDHTVSLPDPGLFFSLPFDEFMCDPDGDDGTGPDTPAEGQENPTCPEGSTLEVDISPQFWGGFGNGVNTGPRDGEHSGIRGAQAEDMSPPAAGIDPFDVRFADKTGKKPIKYFCFLHPMEAFITVN